MPVGAFTEQLDLPLLLVMAFFLFFLGLVFYLRQEDKREGYPLQSDRPRGTAGRVAVVGFPPLPKPKTFLLRGGKTVLAPRAQRERELNARPAYAFPGSPLMPLGDPLLDGIGPASYALKANEPDRTYDGDLKMVPMRDKPQYRLEETDIDLFGMPVFAADGAQVGIVHDLWINAHEYFVRYVEVELTEEPDRRRLLAPYAFCSFSERPRRMNFKTLTREQFLRVPIVAERDSITMREEDRINGYFAGGTLYAKSGDQSPFL